MTLSRALSWREAIRRPIAKLEAEPGHPLQSCLRPHELEADEQNLLAYTAKPVGESQESGRRPQLACLAFGTPVFC